MDNDSGKPQIAFGSVPCRGPEGENDHAVDDVVSRCCFATLTCDDSGRTERPQKLFDEG